MNKSALKFEISRIKVELKEAENNLERVKETYRDEKNLLNFYLPSAEKLVNGYQDILHHLNDRLKLLFDE